MEPTNYIITILGPVGHFGLSHAW